VTGCEPGDVRGSRHSNWCVRRASDRRSKPGVLKILSGLPPSAVVKMLLEDSEDSKLGSTDRLL